MKKFEENFEKDFEKEMNNNIKLFRLTNILMIVLLLLMIFGVVKELIG